MTWQLKDFNMYWSSFGFADAKDVSGTKACPLAVQAERPAGRSAGFCYQLPAPKYIWGHQQRTDRYVPAFEKSQSIYFFSLVLLLHSRFFTFALIMLTVNRLFAVGEETNVCLEYPILCHVLCFPPPPWILNYYKYRNIQYANILLS